VIARIPPITAVALPVWGFKAGTKANPICVSGLQEGDEVGRWGGRAHPRCLR
jgi:hypothetical protein